MNKQTAVEWLLEQLRNEEGIDFIPTSFVEKAKQMEKEQIKNAWVNAWQESFIEPLDYQFYEPEAEQYYTETYG